MRLPVAILVWLIAACDAGSPPPVEVSDLRLFAPLPGATVTVAYLTIHNNSPHPLSIVSADSPQFARVAIHRSAIRNGVASMRPVERIDVPPDSSVALVEGGLHIMLMDTPTELAAGDAVSLTLHTTSGSEIVLRSELRPRVDFDNGDDQ